MKTFITYKKQALLFAVFFCSGLFMSCSLDEVPYDFYSTDTYYENTNRLNAGVLGVYEVFSELGTYGQYWMVYDTDTDISHISGAGTPGGHPARDIGHYYNLHPNNAWLQSTWALYYTGIDRANLILENQDHVQVADAADLAYKKQLIAETKCLRAMCYFDLITLFGDVPLKLTYSRAEDNFRQGRTDKETVYNAIIQDLEEAYPDMEWANGAGYKGRLSKGAALGLLSRTYLFRGGYSLRQDGQLKRPDNYLEYYQKVVEYTDMIIDSGKHGLLSSYEDVFRNMCRGVLNPFENMYEVQFYNLTGENKHSSMMGTYNGPAIAAGSSYGRANSFIKTHKFFYDTYDASDLRKDVAVVKYQINAQDVKSNYNDKNSYSWAPGKWRRDWQTFALKDNNNTDCNVLLLRYADILLMRAEVENEIHNGPTEKAIDCVNQIKRRAWGHDYLTADAVIDYTVSSFSSKESFFTFLKSERARELCFEGLRRFDLIRWNVLKKAIDDTTEAFASYYNTYRFTAGEYFTTGKHELYPIPLNDIIQTEMMITQNPGYSY